MKSIITTLIFFSISFIAQSQNVGIGTTSPVYKLQVNSAGYGIIHSDLTNNVQVGTYVSAIGGWLGTRSNHNLHFYTNNSNPLMTLDLNGRLGIGTQAPAYILDVNGRMRLRDNGPIATAGIWHNKADNTEAAFIGMVNDSTYGFYGNGNWRMGFDVKNAQMGIGITDPTSPLSFATSIGKKISLYHGATGDAGFGVFGNELRINSDYNQADITFGYDNYTNGFTEKMRVKANGNVGIGTNAPGSMLEIKSTAFSTADIEINGSAGDNAVLRLNKNGSSNYSTLRFKTSGTVNWDLGMQGSDHFKLQYTPNNATIMDVDNVTRNIGFLTNDFSESVNIGGSLGVLGAAFTKGNNAGFQFYDRNANAYGGWNWYADAGKANLFRYGGLGNTLTIDQAGNLGVGTASPNYKLDVNGRMRLRHNGITSGLWFNNSLNAEAGFIGQYTDNLFGIYGSAWQFAVNRNDGTVYMGSSNLDNENLNLGTGYKLRVFGKIISEEVRVQLKNAWPDYVFENNYKKLSLNELEQFVKENKHLPNIPSAKEIEKDGQMLGDLQRKMMEKIEELSLYIIDQNKAIEALKKRVNQIEKN